jgi:hypothetical protein
VRHDLLRCTIPGKTATSTSTWRRSGRGFAGLSDTELIREGLAARQLAMEIAGHRGAFSLWAFSSASPKCGKPGRQNYHKGAGCCLRDGCTYDYFLNAELSCARVRPSPLPEGTVSTWTLPPEVEPMSRFLLADFCHSRGLLLCTLAPSPRAKVSAGVVSTKAAKSIALPDFKCPLFGIRII